MNRSQGKQDIEQFVGAVRRRLNRQRWWHTFWWTLCVSGAILLGVALIYVGQGYQVPWQVYPIMAGLTLAAAAAIWLMRRNSTDQAARYADEFFGLYDGITSWRGFARRGKHGGLYELQAHQITGEVTQLSPRHIRPRRAPAVLISGLLLVAAAVALGFKGPSETVREQQRLASYTRQQTQQNNKEIKRLVEEMLKQTPDDEKKLIDPSELRKWVDELKETENLKEAMRQYARFEQKLREKSNRLRDKRDEQLLTQAAKELQKAQEAKDLGKKLENKKYKEAAKELAELKKKNFGESKNMKAATQPATQPNQSKQAKKPEPQKQKKLTKQEKRELEKLKKIAAQLARAARQFQPSPGNQQGNAGQGGQVGAQGQPGQQMDLQNMDPAKMNLSQLMQSLEQQLELYDGDLKKLERDPNGEGRRMLLRRLQQHRKGAADRLARLSGRLRGLDAARRLNERLARLREQVGQRQGQLAGQSQMLVKMKGGKKAGVGTARNENKEKTSDTGLATKLEGMKGHGPAQTTVEAAADGTGVSSRHGRKQQVKFQRQMESFVQREDVPEPVKEGVKQYLVNIHTGWDEAEPNGETEQSAPSGASHSSQ